MKKILLFGIVLLFSSCSGGNTFTTCPCIVTSVEKNPRTQYKIRVQSSSDSSDFLQNFTIWSEEPYTIGDTLKFVRRK